MSRIYGEACEQEGDLQAGFIYSAVGTVWIRVCEQGMFRNCEVEIPLMFLVGAWRVHNDAFRKVRRFPASFLLTGAHWLPFLNAAILGISYAPHCGHRLLTVTWTLAWERTACPGA